jgi:hypothetical protein
MAPVVKDGGRRRDAAVDRDDLLHVVVQGSGDVDISYGVHRHSVGRGEVAAQCQNSGRRRDAAVDSDNLLHHAISKIRDIEVAAPVHRYAHNVGKAAGLRSL